MSEQEQERERTQAETKRINARKKLRAQIGKIAAERTTESGKACIAAAQQLVEMDELVEARHWVSLSLTADKVKTDVKIGKALEKLDQKGKNEAKFRAARRGSKAEG